MGGNRSAWIYLGERDKRNSEKRSIVLGGGMKIFLFQPFDTASHAHPAALQQSLNPCRADLSKKSGRY